MTIHWQELEAKAIDAIGPGASNAAQRILLFPELLIFAQQGFARLAAMRKYQTDVVAHRRELTAAVLELQTALSDWSIGAESVLRIERACAALRNVIQSIHYEGTRYDHKD